MPFESADHSNSGIVYVWIGSKSSPEEAKLIQDIAEERFNNPWVSLQVNKLTSLLRFYESYLQVLVHLHF